MSDAKQILLYGANQDIREGRIDFPLNAMFTFLEKHTVFDHELVEKVFWERIDLLYKMKPKITADAEAKKKDASILSKSDIMDERLKDEILNFFMLNSGYEITFPQDWTNDLEKHLLEKGFDLETIIQYKNKQNGT